MSKRKIFDTNTQAHTLTNVSVKSYQHRFGSGLVSLFNGIPTFVGYLMPKPSSYKNGSGTI